MNQNYPQSGLASLLASKGRGEDSVLVHMTPGEVQGLQALAMAQGGSLTVNPETGLAEAGYLDQYFKSLIPTVAGGVLNYFGVGPALSSLIVGGVTTAMKGDLTKGIVAGMGAYSGANIREALAKMGTAQPGQVTAPKVTTTMPAGAPGVSGELSKAGYTPPPAPTPAPVQTVTQQPAMPTNPTMAGLRALGSKGGFEEFVKNLGGKEAAGKAFAPILASLQQADVAEKQKEMRRMQERADFFPYYNPGQFDPLTGTFAPGYYQDKSGRRLSSPYSFAEGGNVGIDPRSNPGGDPSNLDPRTAAAALAALSGPVAAPSSSFAGPYTAGQTSQFIGALNDWLKRTYTQSPASGGGGGTGGGGGGGIGGDLDGGADEGTSTGGGGGGGGGGAFTDSDSGFTETGVDLQETFPVYPRPPFFIGPTETIPDREGSVSVEEIVPGTVEGGGFTVGGGGAEEDTSSVEVQEIDPGTVEGGGFTVSSGGVGVGGGPNRTGLINILELPEGFQDTVPVDVPGELDPLTQELLYDAQQELEMDDFLAWLEQQGYGPEIFGYGLEEIQPTATRWGEENYGLEEVQPTATRWTPQSGGASSSENESFLANLFGSNLANTISAQGGLSGAAVEALQSATSGGSFTDILKAGALGLVPDIFEDAYSDLQNLFSGPNYGLDDIQVTATRIGGGGGGRPNSSEITAQESGTASVGSWFDSFLDWLRGEGYADGGPVKRYAAGGLGSLSGAMGQGYNFGFSGGGTTEYAAGGKYLNGPGDGMSDDIKANIEGKQEARLADGEFVIPADVVSHLGNGSSNAGAKKLHQMMDRIRQARTGRTKQAPAVEVDRFLPA